MAEDLNIRNNIRILVLKALNKFEHGQAAAALGTSKRTLSRLKREFSVFVEDGVYKSRDHSLRKAS